MELDLSMEQCLISSKSGKLLGAISSTSLQCLYNASRKKLSTCNFIDRHASGKEFSGPLQELCNQYSLDRWQGLESGYLGRCLTSGGSWYSDRSIRRWTGWDDVMYIDQISTVRLRILCHKVQPASKSQWPHKILREAATCVRADGW